jgi:hypothetical protein
MRTTKAISVALVAKLLTLLRGLAILPAERPLRILIIAGSTSPLKHQWVATQSRSRRFG